MHTSVSTQEADPLKGSPSIFFSVEIAADWMEMVISAVHGGCGPLFLQVALQQ